MFDQFTSGTNGSTTTKYTYAGPRNDERLTAGGTSFLNGSLGITQLTRTGRTASFIRDPEGTLISMRDGGGASFYYTTDALGSVILLTDGAQAKAATYGYDSWGESTGTTGTKAATNPWTYADGYNDTTNNRIKFGARYYHPARGRFTQVGPSGQEQNRYAYADCNPINNIDPSGLSDRNTLCFGSIFTLAGSIGAMASGGGTWWGAALFIGSSTSFYANCLQGVNTQETYSYYHGR